MGAVVDKGSLDGKVEEMPVCEGCSTKLHILKRKRTCEECKKVHCVDCLPKLMPDDRINRNCTKCNLLISGNFSRDDLAKYRSRDLQQFLTRRQVSTKHCKEKNDLVGLMMERRRGGEQRSTAEAEQHARHVEELRVKRQQSEHNIHNRTAANTTETDAFTSSTTSASPPNRFPPSYASVFAMTPSLGTEAASVDVTAESEHVMEFSSDVDVGDTVASASGDGTARVATASFDADDNEIGSVPDEHVNGSSDDFLVKHDVVAEGRKRIYIIDVKSAEAIEELSIRQLKEILINSHVDYRGCCERAELVQRVTSLWTDNQNNLNKVTEMEKAEMLNGTAADMSDVCKICMSAIIDCVLLNCGHMVTCTLCGKQLAECPICRQYIGRVVHIFKA